MTIKYEATSLHPRIAHWIDEEKLLYIHEHRISGGQIDFLTISPRSGCVSIIEGKMEIDSPRWVMDQVNRYEHWLGVAGICKMVFSYQPISEWHWNIFEMGGFEAFVTGEDAPAARIKPLRETYDPFWEVFEYFYDRPLTDIFRGSGRPKTPIEQTFTVSDVSAMIEGDEALTIAFTDGWGLLDMPYGNAS